MIQFGQLCSLLGMSGGKVGGVLEAVIGCSVLVQGCWVVDSHVIFLDASDAAKRNARDYIVRVCVWYTCARTCVRVCVCVLVCVHVVCVHACVCMCVHMH